MRRTSLLKLLRDTGMILTCALLLVMGHCTTRVIPPVAPMNPENIYLCDYGIHSSLLLPVGDGRYVEYLYGDWNWAVLGQKGTLNGGRSIFFSKQSALGRRYLTTPMPPEQPKVSPIVVTGSTIRNVISELDVRFDRQKSYTFQQSMADGGYLYVKDNVHYSVLHDCNSNTAEDLRKMGCTVVGLPVWSDFTVEYSKNVLPQMKTDGHR